MTAFPPSVRDAINQSSAELEAVERDAARYRFLRDRDLDAITEGGVFAGMTPDNVVLNGDDLDRHVDRMMHSEGPKADE